MKHKYREYRDADIGNWVTNSHDIDNEYIEPLNRIEPQSLKCYIGPAIISSKYCFFFICEMGWKHNVVAEPYVRVLFYSYPIFLTYC